MPKIETAPELQQVIVAGPDYAAIVMLGIFIFGAIVAIVLTIYALIQKRSRKPTAAEQEKRARVVAARHKYLGEHE